MIAYHGGVCEIRLFRRSYEPEERNAESSI